MAMTARELGEAAGSLFGDMGVLAAVAWHRTGPVEQLEVERISPILAARLGLLHDLAVAAGHDLDVFALPARCPDPC